MLMPGANADLTAAGLILRRQMPGGDRWLLLQARKHREWGFPKGHQDAGESILATALRECAEETSIALLAVEGEPMECHYRLPSGRSKRVVYFPAVTASDAVVLSNEHIAHRWSDASEVALLLPHENLRTLFAAYLRHRGC